jgi:hypothetical protein
VEEEDRQRSKRGEQHRDQSGHQPDREQHAGDDLETIRSGGRNSPAGWSLRASRGGAGVDELLQARDDEQCRQQQAADNCGDQDIDESPCVGPPEPRSS